MVDAATLDLTRLADDLGRAAENAPAEIDKMLIRLANVVLIEMTQVVPVDTGRLKASIAIQAQPGRVVIGPQGVEYATYVEFGTRPHTITAKGGGLLAFNVGGKKVFARSVKHPGTRPKPYARPAARKALDSLGPDAARVGVQMVSGKVDAA